MKLFASESLIGWNWKSAMEELDEGNLAIGFLGVLVVLFLTPILLVFWGPFALLGWLTKKVLGR